MGSGARERGVLRHVATECDARRDWQTLPGVAHGEATSGWLPPGRDYGQGANRLPLPPEILTRAFAISVLVTSKFVHAETD